MKLSYLTDPSTIMFEGYPDIPIKGLTKRVPEGAYVHIGADGFFGDVEVRTGYNHGYDEEGNDVGHARRSWPRIVPRIARLDPAKPLKVRLIVDHGITSQAQLDQRNYRITGRLLPAIGDEPEVYIIAGGLGTLHVDPDTGRVVSGEQGSNLQFYNDPDPVVELLRLYSPQLGRDIHLTLTSIGGTPTEITLS